jgi:triacylglycerol lipase
VVHRPQPRRSPGHARRRPCQPRRPAAAAGRCLHLAGAYDSTIRGRTYRFVNNNDIVPQVPAGPPYRHVAETRYFDSAGRLRDTEPSPLGGLTDKVRGHAAGIASFKPGTDGFTDHFIDAYIDCLEAAAR